MQFREDNCNITAKMKGEDERNHTEMHLTDAKRRSLRNCYISDMELLFLKGRKQTKKKKKPEAMRWTDESD